MKYLLLATLFSIGCGLNLEADVYEPKAKKEEIKETGRQEERGKILRGATEQCVEVELSDGSTTTVCYPRHQAGYRHTRWDYSNGELNCYYWYNQQWYWFYTWGGYGTY